jgi:threonine dehydrogenase-like Zn-dependent dehydrogenase
MTKVLFSDKKKKVVIEDTTLPITGENQVKIKTEYSYISAGTELTIIQMGKVNIVQEVQHNPLGYSMCGYVLETGSNVTHVKKGDAVACVGAGAYHATEVLVAKNLVVPVPKACSMREAAMSAMGCFALEGVRKANIDFGENVLVVGGGLMGQFVSQYVSLFAGKVILIERNNNRLATLNKNVTGLYADDDVWDKISEMTAPTGVEKTMFCLGGNVTEIFDNVKKVMCKSPDNIPQGSIVFSGGATITVTLASQSGNLKILSSAKAGPGYRDEAFENGADYPCGYVKWTVNRNVSVILLAVADKKLCLEKLITHEYKFQDALQAYKKLAEPDTDALAVLLKYN